ncbi:MAG TPA: GGDEF domain-containing protein [Solirubrobacteraceae bacterium]|jgi:diguanylate cyclase (GGDEF)-like protein|nr:GGDEF domain-containing protein [Solirubrobacteraceae bacterium]
MLRPGVDGAVRAQRPRNGRTVAPAPIRVGLITVVVGVLAALIGGSDGFWVCLPGVLLAASVASTAAGAICSGTPVLLAGVLAALAAHKGPVPPVWLVVLVPGACLLVLHGVGRRLRHDRDRMEHAALSDPLTGLANRRMLMSMAEYEIARHRRADARFVVVMIDLDGFKLLNDSYGHAAGDQMLRNVAAALRRALRLQDTVARLGGDEFCVIAPETDNPRALADKVVDAVAEAATGFDGLQTSVGVSVFPEDGTTIELLLRTADGRLLAAKRRRRSGSQRRAA